MKSETLHPKRVPFHPELPYCSSSYSLAGEAWSCSFCVFPFVFSRVVAVFLRPIFGPAPPFPPPTAPAQAVVVFISTETRPSHSICHFTSLKVFRVLRQKQVQLDGLSARPDLRPGKSRNRRSCRLRGISGSGEIWGNF